MVFSLFAKLFVRFFFIKYFILFIDFFFSYFSIALYIIICLLMHITGGRNSVVKKMTENSCKLLVQTPPFCCVFFCLPKVSIEALIFN